MNVYTIFGIVAAAAFGLGVLRFVIKRPANLYITFLQDFIGVFFIFSGFVKAVDPLGTSYKMHEYFDAFAQEGGRPLWEFMSGFSTPIAILMIAAELFFGFMLLMGWRTKVTVAVIWWLTLFFTFLTGYTYLSGYCISKTFIVASGVVMLLFAALALPLKAGVRRTMFISSIGLLIALFLFSKFSGQFLLCAFTETKMKVTDCGCFGDFIKLKPWETFYKDVILDVMILALLLTPQFISEIFSERLRNISAGIIGFVSIVFCLYNVYWNEPVLDFRPYAVGNNIPEQRKEKKPAVIQMQWQYRNKTTGQWETITYDDVMASKVNYDLYDTNYREDKVLDPGIPAKITNLRIEDDEGNDLTDELFAEPGYSFMVVSQNLHKTNEAAFQKLNEIAAGSEKAGIKFFAVTVNDGQVEEFRHRNQCAYPFYHADETPLKTIIRSNPGLVLLKNGTVMNKWHFRHLPAWSELQKELNPGK